MSSYEEIEQVEFTRMEKVLAAGLVVFLLIGGSWILGSLGRVIPRPDWQVVERSHDIDRLREEMYVADRDHGAAANLLSDRRDKLSQATIEYEFRREEYRTRLDAGVDDPALRQAHELARDRMEAAEQLVHAAEAVMEARKAAFNLAIDDHNQAWEQVSRDYSRLQGVYELRVFLLRLAYALPLFLLSLVLWQRFRARHTRHLIILTSVAAFAALQLLFLMGQYAWTLFREAAQLAISIGGSAITIGGLIALRRILGNPDRQVLARLRRGQCPGCGFPLGGGPFCHRCGSRLTSECSSCGAPELIHASHCSHCGSAR